MRSDILTEVHGIVGPVSSDLSVILGQIWRYRWLMADDATAPDPDSSSYSQGRARIAEILRPWIDVSRLDETTRDPNPLEEHHGLACAWALPDASVAVFIREASDPDARVAAFGI
jgi:hypothetical protein